MRRAESVEAVEARESLKSHRGTSEVEKVLVDVASSLHHVDVHEMDEKAAHASHEAPGCAQSQGWEPEARTAATLPHR